MKLKVKVLKDAMLKQRRLRAGQEIVLGQEEYIDWYFEVGRNIPHDVKEVSNAS